MTTHDLTANVDGLGAVPVRIDDSGDGRPVLLLHGGAGPQSVADFAARVAGAGFRVITPSHPGFGGTPRPDVLHDMAGLGAVYCAVLAELDLQDVVVVGNSIGGWIAAQIGLRHDARVARLVLVDAVGLCVPDDPIVEFFALTMDQVTELSYYRPDDFRMDADAMPDAARQAMAANRDALRVYGGDAMCDPRLQDMLSQISVPTLAVWGAADRVVPPSHGRIYADAVAQGRLEIIPDAGHLPQLETPDTLLRLLTDFAG